MLKVILLLTLIGSSIASVEEENADKCDLCKTGVQFIIDELTKTEVRDEIKETITGICYVIPIEKWIDWCIEKIWEAVEPRLDDIVKDLTPPVDFCKELGLCA